MLNGGGGFDGMGILCVFCVYDTIGNRCFEKTSFPKKHLLTLRVFIPPRSNLPNFIQVS